MVRLDPILSDPDEDRMHNKIGAAMFGAVLGGAMGFWLGCLLAAKAFLGLGGTAIVGAIVVGAIGFWFGERFTHFVGHLLRNGFQRSPLDRDD